MSRRNYRNTNKLTGAREVKRIYYGLTPVVIYSFFFLLLILSSFLKGFFDLEVLLITILFGCGTLAMYLLYFLSNRSFDEKGYQYLWIGGMKKFYWKDVRLVFSRPTFPTQDAVTIWFDNSKKWHFLRMSSFATKEYYSVLKEMVECIQIEKPKLKIDKEVLRQIGI
jgi:hypothetical protein